ncbi:MAG: GTP-binding protein, partial [Deltaproteobacteria bacterium]|nr:GTP-binding protein [Deltaproteobacteria bacterium]
LGSRDGFSVSAKLGSGIKELRDKLILLSDQKTSKTLRLCSVALVGRTNVGKSALFNSLMSRVNAPFHSKVCPDAHTTRDFVEGYINYKRLTIRVLDCAGFKRGLPRLKLEAYVMDRIRMALELSEIIVLVLSGDEFVTSFDRRILSKLEASGKKLIIVVNKWDLGKIHLKDSDFRRELPEYYPILFVSALYKKNLNILLETIYQLFHRSLKIEEIERVCFEISRAYPAPFRGNAINSLEKVIFDKVNSTVKLKFKFPELIKRNYLRAFEKKFRSELDTSGMCLKFSLLQSKNL